MTDKWNGKLYTDNKSSLKLIREVKDNFGEKSKKETTNREKNAVEVLRRDNKSPLKLIREVKDNLDEKSKKETTDREKNAVQVLKRITPVRVDVASTMQNIQHLIKTENNGNNILFHKFLALCREDKSPEMERVIQKARSYYMKCRPEYTSSQEFGNLLIRTMSNIRKDPRSIYVYIKDVVDEMKIRRLKSCEPPCKKQKLSNGLVINANNSDDPEPSSSHNNHDTEGNSMSKEISKLANNAEIRHKERRIKKLSKALKCIHNVIAKLEVKEVDFEDDNDSHYIKLGRYKDRFVKIHQKLCELTGESCGSKLFRRRIAFSGTDWPEVNKCIEKFVNKTGQFPDYRDILTLVQSVQSDANLSPKEIERVAEKAFLSVGKQLKKQRQYESWDALSVFLKDQADPAENSADLESRLQTNYEEYASRIQDVIDSFAEKQVAEKLVAEEVPDEDANKSEESGQEEEGEEEEEEEEEDGEKDFVDKVLRGEENISSDEEGEMHDLENDDSNAASDDSEIHDNDIVKKCDVSAGMSSDGEKDQKSCNKYSNNECSDRWTVIDIHRTGRHGPVSPPVIGEDLSERGLCYFKLPCNEDDDSTKEKPSMSREHEHNDDFVSESEEKLTSRPASVLPAELSATEKKAVSSEKMLRSDTKSLDLEHNINDVKSSLVPHHSNPKQETDVFENTFKISDIKASSTPNVTASVSHSTTRDCVGVKSSQPKQSDKSNARVLFPDNKNKHSAEILDENDILVCSKDEKIFEKDAEDSDEPDIIVTQPDSVIKKKSEHCLDTLKSKYCKNNKFVVTRMEVQSESKPKIFEVPSSSRGDTRRGHDKPISPEVITLE
ncbi:death domain-associated protein 6-like isoform X2 [Periplaneta americana]|uniref:death domain-associated protein 6-like isoform X2 n=1 Tax=Periplaneta americana TaxID=6978 RepID=UPI0037E98B46